MKKSNLFFINDEGQLVLIDNNLLFEINDIKYFDNGINFLSYIL